MGFALPSINADAAVYWRVAPGPNSYSELSGNAVNAQVATPVGNVGLTGSYSHLEDGSVRFSYVGATFSTEFTKASALMRPLSTVMDATSPFKLQVGYSYTSFAW